MHQSCVLPCRSRITNMHFVFHLPITPRCLFSPSHQPPLALLARSHALRLVPVHYPQEKPLEEAGINSHGAAQGAAYNETANQHHRLMKTSSKRSKRRDPHPCDNIVQQHISYLYV